MEMDGQSGDENREIEVDPGQASQAERDGKKVEPFHGGIIRQGENVKRVTMLQRGPFLTL